MHLKRSKLCHLCNINFRNLIYPNTFELHTLRALPKLNRIVIPEKDLVEWQLKRNRTKIKFLVFLSIKDSFTKMRLINCDNIEFYKRRTSFGGKSALWSLFSKFKFWRRATKATSTEPITKL